MMKNLAVKAAFLSSLVVGSALLFSAGCNTPEKARPTTFIPIPAPAETSETNIIQPGDTLHISFEYSSNYTTTDKILADGSLNLQGVGQVEAAGKTPLQLQAELLQLYEPLVKDDIITVKILAASAIVYVSGAVVRPGKVPLDRPMTALEAIMEADGYDINRAQLSDVTVLRLEMGRQRIYHLDIKKLLRGREDAPFYLKPYDIVHVPAKTFNF